MQTLVLTVAGILLILLAVYDIIYTTLSTRGAGPVGSLVGAGLWKLFGGLSKLTGNRNILSVTGTAIVGATVLSWVLLLWVGNAVLFIAHPNSVLSSQTNAPADNFERIYYTGYALSTMGNGDFSAGSDFWKIYTSVVSFSGLIFITTAITYMVPVLDAVTTRRSLSIRIASVGRSPQQVLLNSWNGHDFKQLSILLKGLEEPLAKQGQMHLSYPVLFYFHHNAKEVALMLNLVVLDEALTLLLLYVPEDKRPDLQHVLPVRKAITTFIYTILSTFVEAGKSDAPPIQLHELEAAGIPLEMPDTTALGKLRYRRSALEAILKRSGWTWKDLDQPVFDTNLDML